MSLDVKLPVDLQLPRTRHLAPPRTIGLRTLRAPLLGLMRSLWTIRTHHTHNIPATGPVIFAPNHVATIDGPLVVLLSPGTFALAKAELFDSPAAPLLKAGQIALARDYPDARALRTAIHTLRSGHRLTIFPEGKRGAGDFDAIHGGLGYLALVTGAPIVPVAIFGTESGGGDPTRGMPPRGAEIDVVYGGAVRVAAQPWPRRAADVRTTTSMLRTSLREHLAFAAAITGR